MSDLTSNSWFGWALALIAGIPLVLVLLTELQAALARRGSVMANSVGVLRNFVVPAGALWLLLTQAWDISEEATWVRIIATLVGFLVLVIALAAVNAVLFANAAPGSWRQRMPSIFIDIGRLVLIVAGLAVLFAWAWGANVGGLFAALGVTTIVLGFALQNAVGSVVSGLLLLFEQPFHLGDWLDTGSVRGRVVEVNWRAVHLDTGNGIQIIPNASLAGSAFTNLSEPAGAHAVAVSTTFGPNDPPDAVGALLDGLAADLPGLHPDAVPRTDMSAPGVFRTVITLRSPAEVDAVTATFQRWAWYASRRAGLHLNGAADPFGTPTEVEDGLQTVAATLHLQPDDIGAMATVCNLDRWGDGETIQPAGTVPMGMRFVLRGHVVQRMHTGHGPLIINTLTPPDFLGQNTLTREPVLAQAVCAGEVVTLIVPQAVLDDLVRHRTTLARELAQAIYVRRTQAQAALVAAAASASRDHSFTEPAIPHRSHR